jgi:hypothetical protein
MQKRLPGVSLLCFFILLLCPTAKAQNIFGPEGVNWVGSIQGYSQPANGAVGDYRVLKYRKVSTTATNPTDGRGQWATTINVQTSGGNVTPLNMPGGGGNGWLLTSGPSGGQFNNKWNFGGVGQAALNAVNGASFNASTDMGINMSSVGRYTFVFKDAGYTGSSFYVGYTANVPVVITHNPATQTSVTNAIATISATLSAAPSSQENFYVRYRGVANDFSTTTNVVQASVTGTTITASIPSQPASTVYYYIFSSTRTLAQLTGSSAGDIALSSLNYADNSGGNYSYTVVAAPAQPGAITGNAVVCANSSQVYSVANDPFATSYSWTLPSGWSGTSTTNSITATTSATGGTISVSAVNNSGTSTPQTLVTSVNGGTSIASQPSTSAQILCMGGAGGNPLTVTADGSALTYQWYSNASNSNTGGTLINGATSASYIPSTAASGTLYYYAIVGGACAPTSITSNVSGAYTVNGLPNDNGGNGAYAFGSFANGSNGGGGFGAWVLSSTGSGGSFSGSSDIGNAWGLWANNGGTSSAVRPFSQSLTVGSTVSLALDNGFIDNGSSVGVRLRNSSGNVLTEFRFVGGGNSYSVNDGTGTTDTGITYTSTGLSNVTFAYTAANTYSLSVTKAGATTTIPGRNFSAAVGGQVPAQIELFNSNAGNGGAYDAFWNNLSIGYPKVFQQPLTTTQTVCQNATATLSVTAYGSNLNYQWFSNATSSNAGGTAVSGATSNVLNVPTTAAGTTYYYCIVSYSGAGSCVAPITSAVSGAVTVVANVAYYADADADGFGDPNTVIQSCSGLPAGYVSNNSDCNDSQIQYVDSDGDGFGSSVIAACGVADNTDCNDADAATHAAFSFYADEDGDGFGTGSLLADVCAVDAATAPFGYSSNNTDCDDSDPNVYQSATLYVDADNDGYTTGASSVQCYGATAPAGYTLSNIGIDCNDAIAAINPGHAEVLYNGIDDNCSGQLDEGFQILSQVLASQCGTTVAGIASSIGCVLKPNATGYRFRVRNTETNVVQTIDRQVGWFSLAMLGTYDYATTYTIDVEVQRNGVWLGYFGNACNVSSPAILTPTGGAQVVPTQCGIVLPAIYSTISTNGLSGVTGYRFRVTDMTTSLVQILDRGGSQWFTLPMLTTYTYGTQYMVEVAVKTTGTYGGYGSPCVVSSPPVPTLVNCGAVIPTKNTYIYTQSLNRVSSYRYELTNLSATPNTVTTIDLPRQYFRFNDFPGYQPGATYSVRIAVMSSGVYSLFGDACSITAPGATRAASIDMPVKPTPFSAAAYPNPFGESFNIGLETSAAEKISVKVYDMIGRLLEVREANASDMGSINIGDKYPSGVYNVIVSQGSNVRTLRVVKR